MSAADPSSAIGQPSFEVADSEQRNRGGNHGGNQARPGGGNQYERHQRHQCSAYKRQAHHDAVDDRVRYQALTNSVDFFFGGLGQGLGRGTEQLDHSIGDVAAESFTAKLVEQTFLDQVRFVHDLAARPIEFAFEHLRFSASA